MSEPSPAEDVYCEDADVKKRVLIADEDTTADTDIEAAILEASRIVDIFMKPYAAEIPLTNDDLTDQIAIITADFSASIFKRRWNPTEQNVRGNLGPDMLNDQDGSGWFAVGLRRIQDYIKAFYTLETKITEVINPNIFSDLMKKGVITPKEARDLMINTDLAITNKLTEITNRTLTEINTKSNTLTEDKKVTDALNKTDIIDTTKKETKTSTNTNTEVQTKTLYNTKKQNSFAFVRSDGVNSDGYETDEAAVAA